MRPISRVGRGTCSLAGLDRRAVGEARRRTRSAAPDARGIPVVAAIRPLCEALRVRGLIIWVHLYLRHRVIHVNEKCYSTEGLHAWYDVIW